MYCYFLMEHILLWRIKLEFHGADTDTDILARTSARMSVLVSASWNANLTEI